MSTLRVDRFWAFFAGLEPAMADFLAWAGHLHRGVGRAALHALGTIPAVAQVHGPLASGPPDFGLLRGDDSDRHARPSRRPNRSSSFRSATDRRKKAWAAAGTPLTATKDQPWEVFSDDAVARPEATELNAESPIRPTSLSVPLMPMPRGFPAIPCWTPWPWRTRSL